MNKNKIIKKIIKEFDFKSVIEYIKFTNKRCYLGIIDKKDLKSIAKELLEDVVEGETLSTGGFTVSYIGGNLSLAFVVSKINSNELDPNTRIEIINGIK